jgi:O-acetyl-ADP-ribose deacetylase (regulator of RNase III)
MEKRTMDFKQPKAKIFISYKTGHDTGLSFHATTLRDRLEAAGYDVWMDTHDLRAGEDWNLQIYQKIPERDVLLLLLANETAQSDWVRREVDVAKGAKVSILPVLVRGNFDKQEALDRLDISRLQYVDLLVGSEEEYNNLYAAIDIVRERTKEEQKKWYEERFSYLKPLKKPSPFKERHTTFGKVGSSGTTIHLTVGNFTEMKEIDVFVNSENAYMQMARFFEPDSTSGILRYRGAKFDAAGNLFEDTIQDEINKKLDELKIEYLPLAEPRVIITSAGDKDSRLRLENGARYIFHAVTVLVAGEGGRKDLFPIRDEYMISKITKDTLDSVYIVDKAHGIISPEDTPQRKTQEENADTYKNIGSILIPLFTTGRGGQPVPYVAGVMTTAILDYLLAKPDRLQLKDIYIAVYLEQDVQPAANRIKEIFEKRIETEKVHGETQFI